ncbi:MAG: DegV family protein, partial [Candidatus Eremiobacteraeota bacterium]|nr:DegV family protein [Candidatus Eremiobacteraeota bacterium]
GGDRALKFTIAHGNVPEQAKNLETLLRSKLRAKAEVETAEVGTAEVGTTVAINLGPGAVGLCAIAA